MKRNQVIGVLASAVIGMGIVLLATMSANANEVKLPDGTITTMECHFYWTQPVIQVCTSELLVCVRPSGETEYECHLKPVKN